MKIICILALLIFLSPGIVFANGKFEADLFFGSYQPSLARFKKVRQVFKLNKTWTYGCALAYQILPRYKIRAQVDLTEFEALMTYQTGMKFRTTTISLLSIVDFLRFKDFKAYGGIGLIDYRVKSWVPGFREFPYRHNFGYPWSTIVLVGAAIPLGESCELKGEVQYIMGADGELYNVPLEWDGFKFLIGLAVKL